MKKQKKKSPKLEILIDLKKVQTYHFVPQLTNAFFPYPPYSQQIDIVKNIQNAIKNKENALIESPTGTGKTLCLLIGCLSSLVDDGVKKKIYYLTRTHSQISQIVSEFKKTVYQCNLNIIASREQLCLNYNISQLRGKQLQKACEELCLQKLCTFKEHSYNKIPKALQLNEFKDLCKKQLVCPYFYSKQLTEKCQITILPFNYLLEWNLFQKNSIDLKDAVVVFDQAHNIDSLCQQGSDMRITSQMLLQAVAQLKLLIKLQSKKFLLRQFKEPHEECKEVEELKEQLEMLYGFIKNADDTLFLSREDFVQKMERHTTTNNYQGIDLGNYTYFCSKGKKVIKLFHKKQLSCDNFQIVIDLIEKLYSTANNVEQFKKFSVTLLKGQLLFRCLDPSLSFKRLVQCKPRSIILSSGTLGNLDIWEKNLQVPFQHKVTTQSFITPQHLYAQVKVKSESNVPFNFSFQGKQTEKQFEQLCKQLQKIQNIINGGIVVAFSNYDLLEKTLKFTSILKKKVFFQTKGGNVEDIYKQYTDQIQKDSAFLFIIIKGRFSQGINFTDKLCRCLVVIGIPFLPLKNSGVIQKMKYLQSNCSKNEADLWYSQQSFRGLNQTIGRAIRNPEDYAVILLMDQRYQKEQNLRHLSGWFTKCLRPGSNGYQHVSQFLKAAESKDRNPQVNNVTKNKHETNLCERLLQFSTPSKSNRKRLKLKIESQSKSSGQLVETPLKKIAIEQQEQLQQEQTFKYMNNQLANFFLQTEQKQQQAASKKTQDQASQQEQQEKTQCKLMGFKVGMRSERRCKNSLDF